MDEAIKNDILYDTFPGTWDTPTNIAKRIAQPQIETDDAIEDLLNGGLLQMKVDDGVPLFGLVRRASSDDEYLVWIVKGR